jgi:hypothetical protein
MTEWEEIDELVSVTIKRAIDAHNVWIERELLRLLPLWDYDAWGEPSLAFKGKKLVGLAISGAPIGTRLAILLRAEQEPR